MLRAARKLSPIALAEAYLELKDPANARLQAQRALTLNPTDADVWNSIIQVLRQLGRGNEAREAEYERDLALGTT